MRHRPQAEKTQLLPQARRLEFAADFDEDSLVFLPAKMGIGGGKEYFWSSVATGYISMRRPFRSFKII